MTFAVNRTHPSRSFLSWTALPALVCTLASAQQTPTPQTVTTPTLPQLRQQIQRGNSAAALAELDRRAATSPAAPGIQRLRGFAFYTEGNLPAADQAFAAALTQDPADREAAQLRGITLFRLGRPAAAIPLLESLSTAPPAATADVPAPVDPSYVLALCYLDTRRYDDARAAFARQFALPPDSPAAYLLAARMFLRREYVPIAQQFARKAIELSPNLPLAHRLLGETELAGNHLDQAIAEFEAERALNPLEPSVYDRLGDAYTRRGDFDRADQSLQEAILLEPNFTGPFILLGKVLLKQSQPAAAANYLEHARDMDPSNYMTHSLLGQAYRQMDRPEDARRETATAQKLQSAADPKLTTLPDPNQAPGHVQK